MKICCQNCKQPYEVEEQYIEQATVCEKCGAEILITKPETKPETKPDKPTSWDEWYAQKRVPGDTPAKPSPATDSPIKEYDPGQPMEYYILAFFGAMILVGGGLALVLALVGKPFIFPFAASAIVSGAIICGFASITSATCRTERITAKILLHMQEQSREKISSPKMEMRRQE